VFGRIVLLRVEGCIVSPGRECQRRMSEEKVTDFQNTGRSRERV